MACGITRQTEQQRSALGRLQDYLARGQVTVAKNRATGEVAFRGWVEAERAGLCDACAYRALSASNSPELRRALARAEAMSEPGVRGSQLGGLR